MIYCCKEKLMLSCIYLHRRAPLTLKCNVTASTPAYRTGPAVSEHHCFIHTNESFLFNKEIIHSVHTDLVPLVPITYRLSSENERCPSFCSKINVFCGILRFIDRFISFSLRKVRWQHAVWCCADLNDPAHSDMKPPDFIYFIVVAFMLRRAKDSFSHRLKIKLLFRSKCNSCQLFVFVG